MGNCLVTKLKSVVDNPNLDYFDSLRFRFDLEKLEINKIDFVYGLSGQYDFLFGGVGVKVKPISNCVLIENGVAVQEIIMKTPYEMRNAYVQPEDATKPVEFIFVGLDKITKLGFGYTVGAYIKDPTKIKYCTNRGLYFDIFNVWCTYPEDLTPVNIDECFTSFTDKLSVVTLRNSAKDGGNYYCTTTALKDFVNITGINYYIKVSEGDVSELSNLTKITNLQLRKPGVYGDITSFGNMTLLTEMNLNNSNISGTIEDWVAAQCSALNPRTTASNIEIRSDKITYDNNGTPTVIGTSGKYISWNKVGDDYNIVVTDL